MHIYDYDDRRHIPKYNDTNLVLCNVLGKLIGRQTEVEIYELLKELLRIPAKPFSTILHLQLATCRTAKLKLTIGSHRTAYKNVQTILPLMYCSSTSWRLVPRESSG